MPTLYVHGCGTFEVPKGRRLPMATEDCGVERPLRSGGNADCTTCRVEFDAGELRRMTAGEFMRLEQENRLGKVR